MKIVEELRKQVESGRDHFSGGEVLRLITEVEREAEFRKKHSIQLCLATIMRILSNEQREQLMVGIFDGTKEPLPSYQGDWKYTIDFGSGPYSFYTITPEGGWASGPAYPDRDTTADEAIPDQ